MIPIFVYPLHAGQSTLDRPHITDMAHRTEGEYIVAEFHAMRNSMASAVALGRHII